VPNLPRSPIFYRLRRGYAFLKGYKGYDQLNFRRLLGIVSRQPLHKRFHLVPMADSRMRRFGRGDRRPRHMGKETQVI